MSVAVFTPLRRIYSPDGDLFHALKRSEPSFESFGEAYLTSVYAGVVKGWKRHERMVLNLIVVVGEIQICVHDEVRGVSTAYRLGPDANYGRLTVPCGLWVAFGGVGANFNLMLNLASIEHDPLEATSVSLDSFDWNWDTR